MKRIAAIFRLVLPLVLLAAAKASAAVFFTTNTDIAPLNNSYDGQDIIVSNCTVTVDGSHTFSSLLVVSNGILTHSYSPTGELAIATYNVANEELTVTTNNPTVVLSTNVSYVISPLLVTDPSQTIIYTNNSDYIVITTSNATEIELTTNSTIPNGGSVLVSYSWTYVVSAGLDLTVTGAVSVAAGGAINANGDGYGSATGPGAGTRSFTAYYDGSGGGDGGSGGNSASNAVGGVCYDSLYQPAALGSGGGASYAGSGGNGGGLIQITAGGNVDIEGVVSANGANASNSRAGGGSGGGIWISAPGVSGAGTITANGGAGAPGFGGGGGGGRIAIVCGNNNFTGTTTAYGGAGANYGGAGTIFTQSSAQFGLLTLNNGGNTGAGSTVSLPTMANVSVSGDAALVVSGQFSPSNVIVGANSILTGIPVTPLDFPCANLTIQPGGVLSVNGLGYAAGGTGPGTTYFSNGYYYGGGGGHGAPGGAAFLSNATGGANYDSPTSPINFGSSGGAPSAGAGGGAIDITVSGTLEVDGNITANGANGSGYASGGGAGGSIWIQAGAISGAGSLTANGGSGANSLGGGGGGGRIAVIASSSTFGGAANCYGGGGANYGGAGTVYFQIAGTPQLTLDNGGNTGPATQLTSGLGNVVIQNGAWGVPINGSVIGSLTVNSNGWLTVSPSVNSSSFTVTGNATFQAGGGLNANSGGYGPNEGFYNAQYQDYFPYGSGGGGHGGTGGAGGTNSVEYGGQAGYDSVSSPDYGGGGGGGYLPYSVGGAGGGGVRMTVSGTLTVNGVISANGGDGWGYGGGGGAGGGIFLSAGLITGTGAITANGGNGVPSLGGGGGGGCIAIDFTTNLFAGNIMAYGGAGANYGGAGTIYFYTNRTGQASLMVDNGGRAGAPPSAILSSTTTSLTVRNGGVVYASGALSFSSLLIGTNALLATSNNTTFAISANNVTIQPGGSLSANAGGYAANSGPGEGRSLGVSPYFPCSGGGNGGYGGSSISNLVSGGTAGYGTIYSPTVAGSGGGSYSAYSFGGSGGGVIELTVSGALQVNGNLTANGGNGAGAGGGGGAGGSLLLNVASLAGSGVISANGGSGANSGIGYIGGGGGGGMIAINLTQGLGSNTFTGMLSAYGGNGPTNGGAGTIYIHTNANGLASLTIDNGGARGTNTPVNYSSSGMAFTVRNGATAVLPSSSETFASLNISSNAWLMPENFNPGSLSISLAANSTIQAGGGIIADSHGYTANSGSGRGLSYNVSPFYPCSGGGHGGYGGFGMSNDVAGGVTYDNISDPLTAGSGGGGYAPYSTGGSGGGLIYLAVASGHTLQVNGVISANGGYGSGAGGGGGSGGAIYIAGGTLTGTGTITANGGSGAPYGGGGGGGRIAFFTTPSLQQNFLFSGNVSAYGGGGANYGGAGTIYYLTNLLGQSALVLDNNGNVGTNTTFNFNGNMNVTVQNGAIGQLPSSGLWSPNSILILSNSAMTALSPADFTLTVNNINIAAGGALYLDGCGSSAQGGAGSGATSGSAAGGGGHGGYGGGNPVGSGLAYDSIQAPSAEGSGGGNFTGSPSVYGGPGGGAMTLNTSGTLTVNGRLSANGLTGGFNAGGGSGGSLRLNVGALAGAGVISVNGGAASGTGGGGGGGRIALTCNANNFTGQFTANGGNASSPGGAGTVFTAVSGAETLAINNGGVNGANTPLAGTFSIPTTLFNLNISGGASVVPLTPLPLLSNLNVQANSTLTVPGALSSLFVGVLSNATVLGSLNVDHLGYPQLTGPGAGKSADDEGSGGGYGGSGGASAGAQSGGATYGSAIAPVDFGSGGGSGAPTVTGGSDGGGALRLSVGGTLNVSGNISANGNAGLQDDSGGGSGGSVWITAGALSGAGTISAGGGNGVLYGGGGGGGGRIAIYAPANSFTGLTNVSGGSGASPGQAGSVFLSSVLPAFQVSSQSPTGLVMNTVSSVNLGFSDAINPASVTASNFTLVTPAGPLAASNLTVAITSSSSVQVNFPPQNLLGTYTIEGATVTNVFGLPLAQPYSGTFSVSLPTISGTVTGTNGAPVAGVLLQPNGGLTGVTTDVNGNYALGIPLGWNGTVTPAFGNFVFVPDSISYTNITGSLTNQNYLMAQSVTPTMAAALNGNNLSINWNGIPGVTYQLLWSTNLINWQPLGNPVLGTNGPMQILVPTGSSPDSFFQLSAQY